MRPRTLVLACLLAATGCGPGGPLPVALEPGETLVWTLEYENHDDDAVAVYVLTSNPSSPWSAFLVNGCVASATGPYRMVAPFSVHVGPAGPTGVVDLAEEQIAALPIAIDSDALAAPVSAEGYRLVFASRGGLDAVLPIVDDPQLDYVELC